MYTPYHKAVNCSSFILAKICKHIVQMHSVLSLGSAINDFNITTLILCGTGDVSEGPGNSPTKQPATGMILVSWSSHYGRHGRHTNSVYVPSEVVTGAFVVAVVVVSGTEVVVVDVVGRVVVAAANQ